MPPLVHCVRNARIRNFDETARVTGIIANKAVAEVENVHVSLHLLGLFMDTVLTRPTNAPS